MVQHRKKVHAASHKKWLFVILGMFIFICLGTVYSWSVFRTPIEEQYQINAKTSDLPYLVFLLMYTLFMVITGKLTDRINPKVLTVIGGLMVGIGWLLSGFAVSFNMIILCYGVISGAGVGIAYGPPIKVISSWFQEKRGLALGLLLSGFGLSPLITAPITKALINHLGVNQTFITIGLFFLIIIPFLGLFLEKPKYEEKIVTSNFNNLNDNESFIDLIKNKKFIGLWLCFVIGTSIGLMIIGISSQIGEELFGIDSNTTAILISVFALFNAFGRPLFGWLTDKFSPIISATFSYVLIFIVATIMFFTKGYSIHLYIISLSILWMNLGAWLSIAPTTVAMYFGQKNYSRNYGILFTAYGIGALIGTPLASYIRIRFGSYQYIFLPIMVLSVIGIIIALFTMKKDKNINYNLE